MNILNETARRTAMWRATIASLSASLCLTSAAAPAEAATHARPATIVEASGAAPERDGSHDFDFMYGTWKAHFQLLRRPLTGSNAWYGFEGNIAVRGVLGFANVDEAVMDRPGGRLKAITVRLYNKKTHEWSIYYGTDLGGALPGPPTVGKFDDRGVGRFYDREPYKGMPIVVRFTWTHAIPNACRFEQAFSADGGKTWETNWISELTRS